MNKTVITIALAAATLGMSTGAIALTFTDGDFDGGVDIGGEITIPVATNYWQWAAGDALTFTDAVTSLTNNYKTLTKPAATNIPLLVGQTKQATIGSPGGTGLNPQIAFRDAAGNVVAPVWENAGNTGKGTMTLPVTAADGTTALGSMTMKVKAAALRIQVAGNMSGFYVASHAASSAGNYAYGGLPTRYAGAIIAQEADAFIGALGGKFGDTLLNDMKAVVPGLTESSLPYLVGIGDGLNFDDSSVYYAGTYGLGIAQGDNIVVNFTNAISTTTTWKAPLKMTVSYL